MLREHYPTDKLFAEILSYLPKMDPVLATIDRYLEDEKLYRLIRQDLSKRWPKTLETGRGSTPVEVILWRLGRHWWSGAYTTTVMKRRSRRSATVWH